MFGRIGLMVGLALAAPAGVLVAQGPGGGPRMMGPTLEQLTAALSLDDAQQSKTKVLLEKLQTETKAPRETMMENMQMVREGVVTRESVQGANQEAMGKIRNANETFYTELKTFLTEDQQKALEVWREQQQQRGQRGNRPPPAR